MQHSLPPLRYELAERAERASRVDGPWSLEHLRPATWVMTALSVIGVILGFAFNGWPAAWGVLIGSFVVTIFFVSSSWAVAKVGEVNVRLTLPIALVTYGLKIFLLGIFLAAMPVHGPVDRTWLGVAIAVGVMVWVACQVIVVWRTPRMYVDVSASPNPADTSTSTLNSPVARTLTQ